MTARGHSRRLVSLPLGVATLIACASGCSALLDWSGFTGGAGDAVAAGDAALDVDPSDAPPEHADAVVADAPVACTGGTCAPGAPAGWTGPVSLYVGSGPAPAACAVSVFDGHGELVAPPASCASCGCEAATGVGCAEPVLSLFVDPGCSKPSTAVSVSTSCTPLLAAAATLAAPALTGGSCAPSGGSATVAPLAWATVARACSIGASASCGAGGSCVTGQPSATAVCVMQASATTACPSGYPIGPQVLYTHADDTRGCGACTCATPSGAACSIAAPAVDTSMDPSCSNPLVMMAAPSGCTLLNGSLFATLAPGAVPTLTGQPTCAVSGGGMPSGAATPGGATSFCCLH